MVFSPVVKSMTSSVTVGAAAPTSVRLGLFTPSSRRSEPKLQSEQSPRSPWRLSRWPTSPVSLRRCSAALAPASPIQIAKHNCVDDVEDNQSEPNAIPTSLVSPSTSNNSSNNNSGSHDLSFSSLWKRRPAPMESPKRTATPDMKTPTGGTIDLVDLRNSLATIRVYVKPIVDSFVPSDSITAALAQEFGQEVTLVRATLQEELDEFRHRPEDKVKIFPDYVPAKERELIKQVAESLRLACQIGESNVSVYKTGLCEGQGLHLSAIRKPRGRSASDSFLHDDIFVDVPSLVQHGKDGFIARLRLRRLNSGGGIRRNMLWDVAESASTDGTADRVSEGGGGVYAVSRSSGETLAMFKPAEEEKFVREGICPGEGAVREEAAYVLDSRSSGFSGVPATAVAHLHVANIGSSKHGAVQRYMMGSIGSMEDFGMPFDLEKANAFVPVEQVHRIGLLDVRTFNTDRHPGNILLIGNKAPYTMIPIDHGCILPSWFHLAEARFDWLEYPQSKVPFTDQSLAYIAAIDSEEDAALLRKLGIREECVTTVKICTLFMKLAATAGHDLHYMGSFMQRSGCFENPSRLELAVKKACSATGIPFSFIANEYGEQKGHITPSLLSRRPPSLFFKNLQRILTQEVNTE